MDQIKIQINNIVLLELLPRYADCRKTRENVILFNTSQTSIPL